MAAAEAAIPGPPAERTRRLPALGQDSGGFTLLEVMVALAIISVALVSLLTLANRSITTHARLQRLTQATLLAQQKMASTEVDARFGRLERNRQEGGFPEPYSAYRWRLDFADTPLPSIKAVTVTVVWGEEKNNESVDLTSLLF